jgi:hypothetical protein
MILVGDFWQLKPIPGPFVAGRLIYYSELFKDIFQHRYELKTILRQGEKESMLKSTLEQIRLGKCDNETEEYLKSLSRECILANDSDSTNIFFKGLPELPGDLITIESSDTGQADYLENTAQKTLALKQRCKVMLTYNINSQMKNGSQGIFVRAENESLVVNFPQTGNVAIERGHGTDMTIMEQ